MASSVEAMAIRPEDELPARVKWPDLHLSFRGAEDQVVGVIGFLFPDRLRIDGTVGNPLLADYEALWRWLRQRTSAASRLMGPTD